MHFTTTNIDDLYKLSINIVVPKVQDIMWIHNLDSHIIRRVFVDIKLGNWSISYIKYDASKYFIAMNYIKCINKSFDNNKEHNFDILLIDKHNIDCDKHNMTNPKTGNIDHKFVINISVEFSDIEDLYITDKDNVDLSYLIPFKVQLSHNKD